MTQPDWNLMDSGPDMDYGHVFFDVAEAPQTPRIGETSDATIAYKSPETAPAPATPATAQVQGKGQAGPSAAQSSTQGDPAAAPAGDPTADMESLNISETVPEQVSQSVDENQKRDIVTPCNSNNELHQIHSTSRCQTLKILKFCVVASANIT